jgi:hypothetical protein
VAADSLVTLSGVLRDGSGAPIADQSIELGSAGISVSTRTNETGYYSLDAATGSYGFFVHIPGGGVGTTLTLSADRTLDITLPSPVSVTLHVTDSAVPPNPVPGVVIQQTGQCYFTMPAADGVTFQGSFSELQTPTTDSSGTAVMSELPCPSLGATVPPTFRLTPPQGLGVAPAQVALTPFTTDVTYNVALAGALAGSTASGTNVTVSPLITGGTATGVSLTFAQVTSAGTTSAALSNTGPAVPSNFQLASPPTYYDLSTTATHAGSITVCLTYDPTAYSDPSVVRLLHWNGSSWDDVTSSLDQTDHLVCGTTTSLSPFVVVQLLQQPQSISFGPLAARVYGAVPITLTATASSGLLVSYTAAGSCTVSGSTLTLTGAGTCAVTASQAGSASWAAAGSVSQSMTITTASLTISAISTSRTYGTLNPTLTPTYAGFVAGDTAASLTTAPTCVTTATASSPVGTYPIMCSGGISANYTFTSVAGTLTVNKAILTLTAGNQSKTYGTALTLGTTSFTTSGLANGDTVTRATLTSTGLAARASVGTYPIVPSAAVGTGLSNYAITYVAGTLTVKAKALNVTASNRTKTYGTALTLGTSAFTTSGLVNCDTVMRVTLTSTGTPGSAAVGTYPIVPSAAVGTGLSNYAITYVAGTLTITRANQTITFAALANRTLAQSPFTVSATASSGLIVTFTTMGACTSSGLNGHTITLIGLGTCTVVASQAGNVSYSPAPTVIQSFTVKRK